MLPFGLEGGRTTPAHLPCSPEVDGHGQWPLLFSRDIRLALK